MRLSRRNVIIGLGTLVGGAGIVGGTGAFSSVQAERGFDVSTAGDSSALLALEPMDTPNGNEYTNTNGGTLSIDISNINLDAITHLHEVFQVTNNGSQPVTVYFEERTSENSSAIDIGAKTDEIASGSEDVSNGEGIKDNVFSSGVGIVDLSSPSPPTSDPGYGTIGVEIEVGEVLELGVYVDTSDKNLNDGLDGDDSETGVAGNDSTLLDQVIVWAEAGVSSKYTAASN